MKSAVRSSRCKNSPSLVAFYAVLPVVLCIAVPQSHLNPLLMFNLRDVLLLETKPTVLDFGDGDVKEWRGFIKKGVHLKFMKSA